nr:pyridoxamine 5'-phosphate oxidase family protein [Candidatus Freyarchaeota archaeon]
MTETKSRRGATILAPFTFAYVEKQLRQKNFGILSTVTTQGRPHSVGVVYGIPSPELPFSLYLITRPTLRKAKNIKMNPNVSFVVPFPHYFLRFIPQSCVQFQGTAEILSADDPVALRIFQSSRVFKSSLEHTKMLGDPIFIRIEPDEKIFLWGLRASVLQIIRHSTSNSYVMVPPDRRDQHPGGRNNLF